MIRDLNEALSMLQPDSDGTIYGDRLRVVEKKTTIPSKQKPFRTDGLTYVTKEERKMLARRNGTPYGSEKLTIDQVKTIRASNESGMVLAKRYGVNKVTISNVRTRRSYGDIA
jgi:hypothetical protein